MNFTFNDIFSNPRYLVAIVGILVILLIVFLVTLSKLVGEEKTPWKLAGKRGESQAGDFIKHVLNEDDYLLHNISVELKKSETELDFVIVNECGVHIIEVKNYVGTLYGNEEDNNWRKVKVTHYGRRYEYEKPRRGHWNDRSVESFRRGESGRKDDSRQQPALSCNRRTRKQRPVLCRAGSG